MYSADIEKALKYTQSAIIAADSKLSAKDSLYLWEWQAGRILDQQNRKQQAIASYQRAFDIAAQLYDWMIRPFAEDIKPLSSHIIPSGESDEPHIFSQREKIWGQLSSFRIDKAFTISNFNRIWMLIGERIITQVRCLPI